MTSTRTLHRHERGAVAVEAALVTPFVIFLIVGIMEFALYLQNSLSASDAVKAGVRIASAQGRATDYAQNTANRVQRAGGAMNKDNIEQLWVYRANDDDEFPLGTRSFDDCDTCVKFEWNGSEFEPVYSDWPAMEMDACAESPPDRIGVYVQLRHEALTGLAFDSITIREANVIRLEPIPATNGCK
ncbi:MAG: TadE/TadG family type IV pilus assembly protein [Dermatophilaceae bacterium]